ncbi:hypothetical protein Tco_0009255 [Tanacetum coccineum]
MANLTFADSHNMVAYLETSEDNVDFAEIVDFLNASPIRYALIGSPTIYVSYIKQFWSTAKIKTINNETQIRAKVDGKIIVITELSMRRDLHFDDGDGITYLTNTEIFENLQLMGYEKLSDKLTFLKPFFSLQWKYHIHTILQCLSSKSTAWNEFGTNITSAVICLAKKQKFNFSKLIFDVEGEDSGQTTEPQHTPTTASPSHVKPIPIVASSSQPKKIKKHRKTKRKATDISQSSGPTTLVADETVHEEKGDSVEKAATTATSLDAEQGSGNINRTQSTAIPNDLFPQGIGLGGSPRCQEAMGDTISQTRFKRVSIPSYDSPFLGFKTLGSNEERIEFKELIDMCTKLSDRVLDLENVKNAQALEIQKLKKRVKKLESKKKSRSLQLKRILFKDMIESSAEKSLEDSETQGRYGHDIGVNTTSTSITTANINITTVEPVTTAGVSVSTAEPSTPPTTITTFIENEDLTIAQTLMKMRSVKSKVKSKERKPKKPVKVKGKDQIEYDADVAQRLQAELDEEARLEREREEEASKAANIAEWDDVQAMMDADYELAAKLQAEEQGEISIKERSKLFVELMNERKKHFARLRAEEQRRKPLNKAQKRNQMSNYLRNMAGYTLQQLRGYSFDEIKNLFETTMRKVNTFVPIESEVDRAVSELAVGSSKRVAKEGEVSKAGRKRCDAGAEEWRGGQDSFKRQKTSESSELAEETRDKEDDELSQEELQQMMIIVPEQGMNVEALQTNLVKEKFNSTELTDDKEREIWVELKRLFEPDIDDELWKLQKHIHDLTWRLYDSCGVHHISTKKGIDIYMLVEKEFLLLRGTLTLMLVAKLLVDQDNQMSRELLRKIFMQVERPRR